MTTNLISTDLISTETGTRPGHVVVSACPSPGGMPRVRRQPMLDAAWLGVVAYKPIFDKSTGVSVPGCRGVT